MGHPFDMSTCKFSRHKRFGPRIFCSHTGFVPQEWHAKKIDEIVEKVESAYWNFPAGRSNRVFLTLQGCLREILKEKGGQHYLVPHMKKAMLERLGELPKTLPCDAAIVQEAIDFLAAAE